jgi:hypothetical protein
MVDGMDDGWAQTLFIPKQCPQPLVGAVHGAFDRGFDQ